MTTLRRRSMPVWTKAVHLGALVALGVSVVHAVTDFEKVGRLDWVLLLVASATIIVGELWRVSVLSTRDFPPISLAASLALPMVTMFPGEAPTGMPAGLIVVVVFAATVVGHLVRWRLGVGPLLVNQLAVRVLVVGLAAVLYREVPLEGRPLVEWVADWSDVTWVIALAMVAVALIAMGLQLLLMALRHATQQHAMLWQSVLDEVGAVGPLALATTSTAAVIALAVAALGPIAVPLFMAPLLLLQLAVGRQSVVRAAQRQTVQALSRLTEQGGFTTQGHAARVAARSTEIGRDLGMAERDLMDLEYAALLHDLGQVALRRPIPGGATTSTSPLDQRRIAHTGASILARTAELSRLSVVIAGQATPFHKVAEVQTLPLQARILRVANAYDDLTGTATDRASVRRALERIRLGLVYEYDPLVVRSLCRVLQREGSISPTDVSRLDV